MQQITNEELGELKKLVEKASKECPSEWTAGAVYGKGVGGEHNAHWHVMDMNGNVVFDTFNSHYLCVRNDGDGLGWKDEGTEHLMKLVAALRNHAASLIATVEAQREALEMGVREWGKRDCFLLPPEKAALEAMRAALPTPTKEGT